MYTNYIPFLTTPTLSTNKKKRDTIEDPKSATTLVPNWKSTEAPGSEIRGRAAGS
jgi:hypothetical protein